MTPSSSIFALPPRLVSKADPALLGGDERHFAAVEQTLADTLADVAEQLSAARARPGREGQELLERDAEIRRLTARLRLLSRYSVEVCLGRMSPTEDAAPSYIGRLGLKDRDGHPLLVDWRSPAAEPFFAATKAHPMGLISRRRYRWRDARIIDYWDESLGSKGLPGSGALDEDSALLDTLGQSRSRQMRDVLTTIAADQDAIIRADPHGPLVVDGGPGTGKTVVALHRAAYLLYADRRLSRHPNPVLFVGPHEPYLSYVADVLPSLGEEGVVTCTLADLVAEGSRAVPESNPRVAALKGSMDLVAAIDVAAALYEEPPDTIVEVDTVWGELRLTRDDWVDAFGAVSPGTPHNEALPQIWDELAEIAASRLGVPVEDPDDLDRVRTELGHDPGITEAMRRAWPILLAHELVADLWEVPAYLRHCAPGLTPEDRALLRRDIPDAWTDADLPLLDAARHRLGDPDQWARDARRRAAQAAEAAQLDLVIDHLIASDDSEMQVMSMLRRPDLQSALTDEGALPQANPEALTGPFGHIFVDEAQELSDAQWAMVLRRCPSRSLTVVGDRAQARGGFPQSWAERLARVGLDSLTEAALTVNYRTPAEVMAVAEPLIRSAVADANVPTSIRRTGIPVRYDHPDNLHAILDRWLTAHDEGTVALIGSPAPDAPPATDRVLALTPQTAKGLEFDLVILLDPTSFGEGVQGAVDRYVAMTRTTGELVILDADGRA